MRAIKKLAGAYLVGISIAVAVFFIINVFLVNAINVLAVWHVLDVLMLVGLALGMGFNYANKRRAGDRETVDQVTRGYLEANVVFYATAVVTILFLHNWFTLLATGDVSQGDNHTAWVIWAVVDTALPIVLGVTGCRLWREASGTQPGMEVQRP